MVARMRRAIREAVANRHVDGLWQLACLEFKVALCICIEKRLCLWARLVRQNTGCLSQAVPAGTLGSTDAEWLCLRARSRRVAVPAGAAGSTGCGVPVPAGTLGSTDAGWVCLRARSRRVAVPAGTI